MQTVAHLITTASAKQLTDEYMKSFLEQRIAEAMEIGPSYVRLWQSIENLLLSGGKRFRPYMLMATYQAYHPDGTLSDIVPAAVAHELIHSAILIHDDIVDRDTIRYGVNNVSGQYNQHYRELISAQGEREHLSLSAALLAGDALIADSHKLLRKTNRPAELVGEAEEILNTAIFEVIGGELLDIEIAFLPKGTILSETIAHYKTASYSFVAPLTTGAILAQAPEQDIDTLKEIALILGIGYQLRDDMLGMFGDEAATGKSNTTDIKEGKRTYLIEAFEQSANERQLERFYEIFHRHDASSEEIQTAKALLIEAGAKAAVESLIEEKRLQAFEKIESLSLSQESKKLYQTLVERCLNREA